MPEYNRARANPRPEHSHAPQLTHVLDRFCERFAARVQDGVRSVETLSMHQRNAVWLCAQLGATLPIDNLSTGFLEAFAWDARAREGVDGAELNIRTVAKRFTTLQGALKLSHRLGELQHMPLFPEFPQGPVEYEGPIIRSYAELQRVLDHLPPRRRDWVQLCFWTGQHSSDVERARWEDVDLDAPEPWIRIRNTKNRRPQGIKIKCPAVLVRVLTARRDRLTSRGRAPKPRDALVDKWSNRSYQLPGACVRAGLEPMNALALRHSAISAMLRNTGITPSAQKFGQWSSYRMMERHYQHALPAQLQDAVEQLDSYAVEQPNKPLSPAPSMRRRKGPHKADGGTK